MILQAVSSQESDDDKGGEDISLYGHSAEEGKAKPKRSKAARLKAKVRDIALDERDHSFSSAFLAVCCCLSVVGVIAALAILQRYGQEAGNVVATDVPPVVIFSYGANTDAALAWLSAAVMTGKMPEAGQESYFRPALGAKVKGAPILPDGKLVSSWTPKKGYERGLRAWVHGDVAGMLRRVHNLGPPKVQDLSQPQTTAAPGGSTGLPSHAAGVPEPDAFLAIRSMLSSAKETGGAAPPGDGRSFRRLDIDNDFANDTHPLVIISHPHHMPYLAALARGSGFEPLTLDPSVYDAVPWSDFGCNTLGYPVESSPKEALEREVKRLESYEQASRNNNDREHHANTTRPIAAAAQATLRFHLCVAAKMERGKGDGQEAPPPTSNSSSIVSGCLATSSL